ncbi:leucine-rich repeat-containing protein 45-like [Chelonus insularis]|uniref:leucine-rich repeat-containing protein 45-like n=1 Tax=Chelonus insularis TaxID=460826 RepID=UPI00158F4A4E|nr:leucine-rich repeat-containing protein 45-like [Chelonus insularis]
MISDYELFNQLCTKFGVCPPIEISNAMKIASSTGELRLPCLSIVVPVCEVIGRVLASSCKIKLVDLSDCMLVSKGLSKIFDALQQGTNITYLNLRGNNITGPIVSQLGYIFHHNNTLKCLYLEWNNLGTNIEDFENFCKGLCVNYNIEELDLRYNQITPRCAEFLSDVLKKNKSIKILNLAWNTLGVQGGQLLLNGMKENNSIIKMSLRGNCIPNEVIETIDNYTYKNRSRKIVSQINMMKDIEEASEAIFKENHEKLRNNSNVFVESEVSNVNKRSKEKHQMENHIRQSPKYDNTNLNSTSIVALNIFEKKNEKNESANFHSNTDIAVEEDNSKDSDLNRKISALNKILHDRTSFVDLLTDEISVKNTEIDSAKSLINQLHQKMNELKDKHENYVLEKTKEISNLIETQKINEENWKKMYKELEETHKTVVLKNKEWETKVNRYEREIHDNSVEIISLREKLINESQYYKNIIAQSRIKIHKVKKEFEEKENKHKLDLNVLKNTLKETTQALEECQAQLQKTRTELRDTLTNLSDVKSKLNDLEQINIKYNKLEDCLQKLKNEKTLLEDKFTDSQRSIASLKRQVNALQGELIEPQRRYDLLKEELNEEKNKTARLKQELTEERSRLKEQDVQIQKMNQQITILNSQINEIQLSHADDIRAREREHKHLKEIIANREQDLNDLKAREAQRAGQLYAAFSKYLNPMDATLIT